METKQLPLIIIANLNTKEFSDNEFFDYTNEQIVENLSRNFEGSSIFVTRNDFYDGAQPPFEITVINPNLFPDEQRQSKLLQTLEELKTLNPNDLKITQCP